ncbi:MAG: hypothetical protein KBA86_07925 [Bacteroidales bacterium]|nr:hypothetical protein [Bacteroidales bacterium]
MRKLSIMMVLLLIAFGAIAQNGSKKIEVLYFKANLSCCQARACQNLEMATKDIIAKNFSTDQVVFKTIALADEANKKLVEMYKTKSQSLIVVLPKKKKYVDLSGILAKYARKNDREAYEKELVAKINELK